MTIVGGGLLNQSGLLGGLCVTTFGVEWNQSTDTWTLLDTEDPDKQDGQEWNQSTDTWSALTGAPTMTTATLWSQDTDAWETR
jgi:hypothetical protein